MKTEQTVTISKLDGTQLDIDKWAKKAIKDPKLLKSLLESLLISKERVRYNSFKILERVIDIKPGLLYPQWDYFTTLLVSDSIYKKYMAVYLITELVIQLKNAADKLEQIFEPLFDLLKGDETIPAAHLALNAGKLAKAKPHLQHRITEKLLHIDQVHHGDKLALVKANIIEAFDEYFDALTDKVEQAEIIQFVDAQLESESPKARKLAKTFLKKHKATQPQSA